MERGRGRGGKEVGTEKKESIKVLQHYILSSYLSGYSAYDGEDILQTLNLLW